MKILKPLSALFVCAIFMLSCETEQVTETNQSTTNIKSNVTESYARDDYFGTQQDNSILLSHLEWVSFISAEAILLNEDAKQEFISKMNANGTIALEELIGSDSSPGDAFRSAFDTILEFNICIDVFGQCGRPGHVSNTPNRPAASSGGGGGGLLPGQEIAMAVTAFKSYVLEENCIELKINHNSILTQPNSIAEGVTSVAHPLNNNNHNNGLKRISNFIADPVDNVDDLYTLTNITLIARPFRLSFINVDDDCAYTEFSNIQDFRDFLE
jgi:hypothetical protein